MARIIARHRVRNFPEWKKAFGEAKPLRAEAGETAAAIYHTVDDPNHVVVVFDWDKMERAKEYLTSLDFRMMMRDAGIAEVPDFLYLEAVPESD